MYKCIIYIYNVIIGIYNNKLCIYAVKVAAENGPPLSAFLFLANDFSLCVTGNALFDETTLR